MTLKILLFFLPNLYFVIPKSNELCIHQVPLVTLFFHNIFQVNYDEAQARKSCQVFNILQAEKKFSILTSPQKGMFVFCLQL